MRPRTIVMIILVVLLTIMILQLVYTANFTIIFSDIPKTDIIIAALVVAFILGYMVGYPGRQKKFKHIHHDADEYDNADTLSEEDRRYID
jgi:uncharacterized integral membrane protein